jgi:hypothetical protein
MGRYSSSESIRECSDNSLKACCELDGSLLEPVVADTHSIKVQSALRGVLTLLWNGMARIMICLDITGKYTFLPHLYSKAVLF